MAGSDSLESKQISSTYKDLLQVPNANSGVDGTARTVMDGEGTESALQVSTSGVKSTGTLESTGNLTVGGSLTLGSTEVTSTATELNLLDGVTAVDTDLSSVSSSDDTLASAKSIKTYVDSQVQSKDDLGELSGTLDDISAGTTNKHFTATDETKLDNIEPLADVTDSTNVTAAGALMDSELTDLAGVKGVTISTLQPKPSEGAFVDGDKTKLDGIATGAIANVSEDTTPSLGGPLNTNGQDIVSASNANIEIAPNGTGKTVFKGNTNAGKITLNCENNSHGVSLASPAHADYSGSWTLTLPTSSGSNGQVLTTNGSGVASWAAGSSVSDLNDLSDVNAGSPSDGQVLKWNNSASEWQAMADNNSGGGGGGSGTVNTGADGCLAYYDGAGTAVNDATNLVWDDANNWLGVGTDIPSSIVHAYQNTGLNFQANSRAFFGSLHSTHFAVVGGAAKADDSTTSQMVSTETASSGNGLPSAIKLGAGNIDFHTAASSTAGAAFDSLRMRIASDGAITGGGLKLSGGVFGHGSSDASSITLVGGNSSSTSGANITLGGTSGSATKEVIFKANSTETMRIGSSGNVGIGTNGDADTRLEVESANPTIRVKANTDNWAALDIHAGDTAACYLFMRDSGGERARIVSTTNNDIKLLTGGGTVSGLTIDSSGNVGIGTPSPSQKLHVNSNNIRIANGANGIEFQQQNSTNWSVSPVGTTTSFAVQGGLVAGAGYIATEAPSNGAIIQGSCGIGTASPSFSSGGGLHINDASRANLKIETGSNRCEQFIDGLNFYLDHDPAGAIVFRNSTRTTRMVIASTGRVTVKKSSNAEVTALTDGATITPDLNDSNNFSVTLGGNRTLANPSNCTAGQSGIITITQDGTGSRTLAYGSYWKFSGGTAPNLTTTASAVDVLAYYVESATRITATLITDTK